MIANETTIHKRPKWQTLTTRGQCTAFNNEENPYHIVSYKRPQNDNVKQFKQEN